VALRLRETWNLLEIKILTHGVLNCHVLFLLAILHRIQQMSDLHIHYDCQPGLIMDGVIIEEINNAHGQHYFKVRSKIGYIFGSEVEGELSAIGATKEQALERLAEERKRLYDSLWL